MTEKMADQKNMEDSDKAKEMLYTLHITNEFTEDITDELFNDVMGKKLYYNITTYYVSYLRLHILYNPKIKLKIKESG